MPGAAAGAAVAAALNPQDPLAVAKARAAAMQEPQSTHFEDEVEFNDYPQAARFKITHRDTINQISEMTGAAIISRGMYHAPGKPPPAGERKLHLVIEGTTEMSVQDAKAEILRVLNEETLKAAMAQSSARPGGRPGKYSVI